MGVKELWSVLTPHADRKPMCELRGKVVAIDLAGWVCESLNVVDYFVHPRHHLKNLFFRACYLIWEEVTPVFVLEGVAPKLKSQVIAKRNELQFRGVRPKEQQQPVSQQQQVSQQSKEKGRTRFNHVLRQCETLLQSMGIQCVQGPGEAEAYCAFMNKKGLVDGVISQDSDCFAYGAVRVYRNFSVSTQGAQAAQGGAVDIYDMQQICKRMDFGQQKIIVMALLCGCDYCPDGVGGVGRDGVLKLFNRYKEPEVLERVRSWRREDAKYTALEMRVDDKSICSNCGHLGRTQSHTKSGCGLCRTSRGCDESLWKEERLALKAELALRKKALNDPLFPNEEIINEFLTEPTALPTIDLCWRQPNIVKFVKQIGHLLQWPEIYCFQKFLPLLTRWQVCHAQRLKGAAAALAIVPREIIKKRIVKGVPSLELVWRDEGGLFSGLIPDEQLREYEEENPTGIDGLWRTVEPLTLLQEAFPQMVESFFKSKEKPQKATKAKGNPRTRKVAAPVGPPLGSLENLNDLLVATDEIAKGIKPKRTQKAARKKLPTGIPPIDRFFKQQQPQQVTPTRSGPLGRRAGAHSSTPVAKFVPSDLESEAEDNSFDLSAIVNGIVVGQRAGPPIREHAGRVLHYEEVAHSVSASMDDLDLLVQKRNLSIAAQQSPAGEPHAKRVSLDDSFDVLVNRDNHKLKSLLAHAKHLVVAPVTSSPVRTQLDRFRQQHGIQSQTSSLDDHVSMSDTHMEDVLEQEVDDVKSVSYFFGSGAGEDAFESAMKVNFSASDDCILISDSDSDSV